MQIKNEIWILADQRVGTYSQSIGLAQELGIDYKIITLAYSFFSSLPNFFLSNSLLRISKTSKQEINSLNYLPKIIISAGRRTAPIALALKKQNPQQIKTIQIMNPNLNFSKFDFVILPKHDGIDEKKFSNLITTIGSLTKIDQATITKAGEKFPQLKEITKTKIALLIGGNSKKTNFDKDSAIDLAKISTRIANNMNAKLLVLTSRRTGAKLTKIILNNLDCDYEIFDWLKLDNANPYLAIINSADFFIVSGDSVSMISECASTSKPLYIFDQKKISTKKHRIFHQDLFNENYAKKLEENLEILKNFSPKKLQETKRIASIIKNKIA
ncbi:MAG: ELM1/GtrOC1 family putative glycosyltransferase [Rickettsiales bacterium]|nr:ELM1/GtrOC1 family putative glycosyltransferase [Rickettsiales bacterium]